jgi:hypothetical protein
MWNDSRAPGQITLLPCKRPRFGNRSGAQIGAWDSKTSHDCPQGLTRARSTRRAGAACGARCPGWPRRRRRSPGCRAARGGRRAPSGAHSDSREPAGPTGGRPRPSRAMPARRRAHRHGGGFSHGRTSVRRYQDIGAEPRGISLRRGLSPARVRGAWFPRKASHGNGTRPPRFGGGLV